MRINSNKILQKNQERRNDRNLYGSSRRDMVSIKEFYWNQRCQNNSEMDPKRFRIGSWYWSIKNKRFRKDVTKFLEGFKIRSCFEWNGNSALCNNHDMDSTVTRVIPETFNHHNHIHVYPLDVERTMSISTTTPATNHLLFSITYNDIFWTHLPSREENVKKGMLP